MIPKCDVCGKEMILVENKELDRGKSYFEGIETYSDSSYYVCPNWKKCLSDIIPLSSLKKGDVE